MKERSKNILIYSLLVLFAFGVGFLNPFYTYFLPTGAATVSPSTCVDYTTTSDCNADKTKNCVWDKDLVSSGSCHCVKASMDIDPPSPNQNEIIDGADVLAATYESVAVPPTSKNIDFNGDV